MFEREVKFIYDFNSNKVKKLGTSATYTELLPLGIHPAILQYISAEIEYRVYEDRQTLLKHSMFDYSGVEISKHFIKITDVIKNEKRFSTDFLSKVILHATSFNLNYLIRPNWSLKKLIFDTSESTSAVEINQILNYAYFYRHIIKVIRRYFEKKKLITLDKEEFSELLIKLDQVSLDTYGNDIIDYAIKSMASFFNIGSMNQKNIPVQAIVVFLQEKKLTSHLEVLQNRLGNETKSKVDVNDLRNILLNIPVERTEYFDVPPKTEKVKIIEEKPVEPEEQKVDLTHQKPAEESKVEVDESEDVEIKLRANKEKEVAETEQEEETIIKEQKVIEEFSEISEDEYHIEQKDELPEFILTGEDTEDTELNVELEKEQTQDLIDEFFEEEPESIEELEEEEFVDTHEELEDTDIDEKIKVELEEEPEFEEPQEEVDELIFEDKVEYEFTSSVEDDYSHPEIKKEIISEIEEPEDDQIGSVEETKSDLTVEDSEESKFIEESSEINEDLSEKETTPEPTLFGDKKLSEEPEDEFIKDFGSVNRSKRIDISDLLENRNMTKIIEVVFDYDMEEFANAIERICDSSSRQEAFATLHEIFEVNQVNPSSKEAQAFKDIISEYFEQS
ncbi:hypothetical protein ASZ90_003190 [hydrocarbon metagenome]|uniref:TerB-C domain-containing protein n=1 Tax=hydrocarbon metagenome TaxID=938273 RepID=A0A0W8G1H0_9ZZZZ